MKKTDTWMPLYLGDYLGDTMHLRTVQHGAYLLLIFHYWMSGKALPDDNEQLSAIARLSLDEWLTHRPTLAGFFDTANGRWSHKRVEFELARAKRISQSRSEGGKKGANSKWNGKTMADPMGEPLAIPTTEACPGHVQSPPHIEEREKEVSRPQVPPMSRKEFDSLAQMRGVPPDCAEWFWNTHDARDWKDATGQLVLKVEPLLLNAFAKWRARKPSTPPTSALGKGDAPSTSMSGAELILRQKEFDRVIEAVARIRRNAATDAMGTAHYTESEKQQLSELRARRDELKKLLNLKI